MFRRGSSLWWVLSHICWMNEWMNEWTDKRMNELPPSMHADLGNNLPCTSRRLRQFAPQANVIVGESGRIILHNNLIRDVFMQRQPPGPALEAPASQLNSYKRSGGLTLCKPTCRHSSHSPICIQMFDPLRGSPNANVVSSWWLPMSLLYPGKPGAPRDAEPLTTEPDISGNGLLEGAAF